KLRGISYLQEVEIFSALFVRSMISPSDGALLCDSGPSIEFNKVVLHPLNHMSDVLISSDKPRDALSNNYRRNSKLRTITLIVFNSLTINIVQTLPVHSNVTTQALRRHCPKLPHIASQRR